MTRKKGHLDSFVYALFSALFSSFLCKNSQNASGADDTLTNAGDVLAFANKRASAGIRVGMQLFRQKSDIPGER